VEPSPERKERSLKNPRNQKRRNEMAFGNWTPITKDNEVERLEDVVIKGTKTVPREGHFSLKSIDSEIALLDSSIAELQSRRLELVSLRVEIDIEAKKILLITP
jgi:hypothetical protein